MLICETDNHFNLSTFTTVSSHVQFSIIIHLKWTYLNAHRPKRGSDLQYFSHILREFFRRLCQIMSNFCQTLLLSVQSVFSN